MKRRWIPFLLACLMLTAAGCSGQPKMEETTEMTTAAVETTVPETTVPTEPPITGTLLLSVSEIHFSVIGEQEDVYLGTVPRDRITWKSDDESIIQVEDGVLTAVGVGTTQVTASCEGQQVSCIAGCLAKDREELYTLHPNVLHSPKRILPEIPEDVDVLPFFENAAMVGDSSTFIFMKLEKGRLGSPQCLCRTSLGLYNQVIHQLDLYHKGVDMPMEDVLADVQPQKAFILLGTNDVRIRTADKMIVWLGELIYRVQEKNPDLEIYLQSVFPFTNDQYQFNKVNENVLAYNEQLEDYCEKYGFHYVPITPYFVDHVPSFAAPYHADEFHPSEDGVGVWVNALKLYAYQEKLKGVW